MHSVKMFCVWEMFFKKGQDFVNPVVASCSGIYKSLLIKLVLFSLMCGLCETLLDYLSQKNTHLGTALQKIWGF